MQQLASLSPVLWTKALISPLSFIIPCSQSLTSSLILPLWYPPLLFLSPLSILLFKNLPICLSTPISSYPYPFLSFFLSLSFFKGLLSCFSKESWKKIAHLKGHSCTHTHTHIRINTCKFCWERKNKTGYLLNFSAWKLFGSINCCACLSY